MVAGACLDLVSSRRFTSQQRVQGSKVTLRADDREIILAVDTFAAKTSFILLIKLMSGGDQGLRASECWLCLSALSQPAESHHL